MILPEISPTAGANADGVLQGSVLQSLFTGTFNNAQTADTTYAYRKDSGAGFASFTDISAAVVSGAPFEPFGPTAAFSVGDRDYLSCPHKIREMFVKVDESGVWAGDGLEIRDSTDGKTANRVLANLVDGSNGFRNAPGVYWITWDQPATPGVAFSPVPGEIAEREWLETRPKNLTAVTTAPKLSNIWLIHTLDSPVYTERTSVHNAALTDASFGTVPQFFPVVGSTFVMVLPFLAYGMDLTVFRKIGTNSVTRVPEYLASDDTLKAMQNFTDGSNYWQNGPVNLGDPTQAFPVRWSVPNDWTVKTRTYTKPDGSTVTVTGYIIQYRVTAVSPYGPVTPPLFRARVRAYGDANTSGGTMLAAATLRGVTLNSMSAADNPATDVQMRAVNLSTGAESSTFTILAADIALLLRGVSRTYDFTDLAFAAGNRTPAYRCLSGAALRNVDTQEIF